VTKGGLAERFNLVRGDGQMFGQLFNCLIAKYRGLATCLMQLLWICPTAIKGSVQG
jgi:hypothetical protein